jgi:nitroreductase
MAGIITLPDPDKSGLLPLEQAIAARRSRRDFLAEPLTIEQIGQLLWAAQGQQEAGRYRTCPSAGATYPLEVFVVTAEGLCVYMPWPRGASGSSRLRHLLWFLWPDSAEPRADTATGASVTFTWRPGTPLKMCTFRPKPSDLARWRSAPLTMPQWAESFHYLRISNPFIWSRQAITGIDAGA